MTLHLSIPDPDPTTDEVAMAELLTTACMAEANGARVLRIVNSTQRTRTADIYVAAAVLLANQVELIGGGPEGDWSAEKAQRIVLGALDQLVRRVDLIEPRRHLRPAAADLH